MTQNRHDADPFQVALLTVQSSPEVGEQMRGLASHLPWSLVAINFENYFSTTRLPPLTQRAIEAQGCIAVVDFDKDPELALQTAECLRQSFYHKIAILALSATSDPDLLLRAMRAGYSEFLLKPFDPDEFTDVLVRLEQRWSSTSGRPLNSGKILSFFGAKGGVGTTTLAVHLAMFLVRSHGKKVLLIDNHAQLGHVVLYLGMDGSNHHFYDLVQNVSRLDQELLRGFIATHASGLDVLSSPDVYGASWKTDADSVERTLEFLSTQYDFVLLDCEASFEDINLAVVAFSNWIYLVATPEIGAVRDLSRYVDGLIQNEQATRKLQVIINRYSSREAVTIEQIEKAVHLPIALKIPNNYGELVRSINVGEPLSPESKSEFSQEMRKWAGSLMKGPAPLVVEPAKKKFALW
ncbi:MAG: AAA family ATPase [Acidobacteriaceae bacterium]